ncbi:MAG: Coq4 family protein [Parerythrobacter sp.]
MSLSQLPMIHPDRELTGFRPIKALKHFGKLVADKEDTSQVFHITEALKGGAYIREAERFIRSEAGQALLEKNEDLAAALDDHDRWTDCAPNSLAQHYIRFMRREGLSAAGLVAESHRFKPLSERHEDLHEWYAARTRDTHDLFHILSGYGRDALGELCLLGFSYQQIYSNGMLFIAYMGTRQLRKEVGHDVPVFAALREGRRNGRAAAKIVQTDLLSMLHEDIDVVRDRLHIAPPTIYRNCLRQIETACCGASGPLLGNKQAA